MRLSAEQELRQKMPADLWHQWSTRNRVLNRKIQQRKLAFQRGLMALGVALFASIVLVGCADSYRFPCQDPKNYSTAACQPPVCEADGTCTKYLLKDQNEN